MPAEPGIIQELESIFGNLEMPRWPAAQEDAKESRMTEPPAPEAPAHTHVWTKLLGDRVMYRCSICSIIGYKRPPSALPSKKYGPRTKDQEVTPYKCGAPRCSNDAVIRGIHVSYCEEHRKRASR